ncbi:MAG: hypothetical protein L3J39_10285 [Verrucomicrobiales bacterium]|nr:hypothetical protein [Verrucomicrobiales bacterium]
MKVNILIVLALLFIFVTKGFSDGVYTDDLVTFKYTYGTKIQKYGINDGYYIIKNLGIQGSIQVIPGEYSEEKLKEEVIEKTTKFLHEPSNSNIVYSLMKKPEVLMIDGTKAYKTTFLIKSTDSVEKITTTIYYLVINGNLVTFMISQNGKVLELSTIEKKLLTIINSFKLRAR